jgi:hypothetical protein
MHLAEHNRRPVREAVDEVHLPERQLVVEGARERGCDERLQRARAAVPRHRDVAEMPARVEVRRRLPGGGMPVEHRTDGPLAVARNGGEPLAHHAGELRELDASVERDDAPDVERLGGSLEVEKGRVER